MNEEKSSGHTPLDTDPALLRIKPPPHDPPPANEREGIRKDLSQFETVSADVQRKNLAATRVIALVTALYMCFAALQWWTMRNQLAEMHGTGVQTDKLIAAANAISGHQKQMVDDNKTNLAQNEAAIEKALKENRDELAKLLGENHKALEANRVQGQSSLDASINASRLDQRAWIGVKATSVTAVEGQPFSAKVEVTNTGKTPALDAHGFTNAEELVVGVGKLTSEATWANNVEAGVTWSRATIYPGGTIFGSVKDSGVLTHDGLALVTKGTHRIYVRVVYGYDDIFGRPHKIRYCGVLSKDLTTLEQCDSGNYAD